MVLGTLTHPRHVTGPPLEVESMGRGVEVVEMVVHVMMVQEGSILLFPLCWAIIWFWSCGTISIGTFVSGNAGGQR